MPALLPPSPRSLALAFALAAAAAPRPGRAEGPSALQVPAGAGQQALGVTVDAAGLRARACPASPCDPSAAAPLPFGEGFGARWAEATLRRVEVGAGRSAAIVSVPGREPGSRWVSIVAAPLRSEAGDARVAFHDRASFADEAGSPETNVVRVAGAGADAQLMVGTRHPELTLCGRPAMAAPRVLDPNDLALKHVRAQQLDRAERERAPRVQARKRAAGAKGPLGRVLAAVAASSGTGSPLALTDGDGDSSWSEARGADGRGEFVVFRAPAELSMTGLALQVRPKQRAVERGTAPRRLWIAADGGRLFQIELPDDAWDEPGAAYELPLEPPVRTSCLALVLEEGRLPKGAKAGADVAVTLTEVEARTEFDGTTDLADLVDLLQGEPARAAAAAALLAGAGPEGRRLVAARYEALDEAARRLALGVLDGAPCAESAPIYARALGARDEREATRARTRLEGCRREAGPALADAALDQAHPARLPSALLLASLDPARAVTALARRPGDASERERQGFRNALARALRSPRSFDPAAELLDDASLPPARTFELLREAGPSLSAPALRTPAARALARVAPPTAPFADRFRALGPASVLARERDQAAAALLARALGDPDARLRGEAARVSGGVGELGPRLLALAGDASPRVRQSLGPSLASLGGPGAEAALARLAADDWTFVRVSAYDALSERPPGGALANRALLDALAKERVPDARVRVVDALIRRRSVPAAPKLKEVADDDDAPLVVRVRALEALGALCHRPSTQDLVDLARRGFAQGAEATSVALGQAALSSLGRLRPRELPALVAALRAAKPPAPLARALAEALDEPERCPPGR
jgi:HEAT repeat protein